MNPREGSFIGETKFITLMANRPLAYTLTSQKATVGKFKDKKVFRARPTGRKRVDYRSFCDEVANATTFKGAEVEAVLRLAAEIAKKHVENGDIVEYGDLGTLSPSFQSKMVEKKEDFNPRVHITKPVVKLAPSKRYFTLEGVTYERVESVKPSGPGGSSSGEESMDP